MKGKKVIFPIFTIGLLSALSINSAFAMDGSTYGYGTQDTSTYGYGVTAINEILPSDSPIPTLYNTDTTNLTIAPISTTTTTTNDTGNVVFAINTRVDGNKVMWKVDGKSNTGYKIVWSKNINPTYPTRDGDKYIYIENPSYYYTSIDAFNGAGDYYVRVCEYINGGCGVYSNEVKTTLHTEEDMRKAKELKQIENKFINTDGTCNNKFEPVCGTNSRTYINHCFAAKEAIKIIYNGKCKGDQNWGYGSDYKDQKQEIKKEIKQEIKQDIKELKKDVKDIFGYGLSSSLEKIPNIESIKDFTNIRRIENSLYGVRIINATLGKEKIPSLDVLGNYKNIEKIGDSLYGIKIADEAQLKKAKRINEITNKLSSLQKEIEKLKTELTSLNQVQTNTTTQN